LCTSRACATAAVIQGTPSKRIPSEPAAQPAAGRQVKITTANHLLLLLLLLLLLVHNVRCYQPLGLLMHCMAVIASSRHVCDHH
jgi:hypothetical protein